MTRRWAKCYMHHCSCGTSCQGHLPGDVVRRVCFMAWGVDLVTVMFHPAWGWDPRLLWAEDGKTKWSSSPLLSSLSRCLVWLWLVGGPHGSALSCWVSWGLPSRGDRLATERWLCSRPTKPALWKQSFVFFCFMTSASGKALAPQVWPNQKHGWWHTGQKAVSSTQRQWPELGSLLGLVGEIKLSFWKGRKGN